jgi:hypothetical protein
MSSEKDKEKIIHYFVDDESQTTDQKELTAAQILQNAGIDPNTNYLVEIRGDHKEVSYEGQNTTIIKLHNNMKFISNDTGPMTVS